MNLEIDQHYSKYSESIVLYLIHNNEGYKDLWVSEYPETKDQANNYFKDVNCGCSPVLLHQYKVSRFHIDVMTVNFINSHPDSIDLKDFYEKNPPRYVAGHVFSIPVGEGHYKEFVSSLQANRFIYNHFTTLVVDDRVLITFF